MKENEKRKLNNFIDERNKKIKKLKKQVKSFKDHLWINLYIFNTYKHAVYMREKFEKKSETEDLNDKKENSD